MTARRTRPLAVTVAWRVAVTVAAALAIAALSSYWEVRRFQISEIDQTLRNGSAIQLTALKAQGQLPWQNTDSLARFIRAVNRFAVVRDSTGRLLQSNSIAAAGLPMDRAGIASAFRGTPAAATLNWPGHGSIRSLTTAVPGTGEVLQLAVALAPFNQLFRHLGREFAIGSLLVTLLATAGAALFCTRTVQPIGEITRQARRLEPGMVGQRIEAVARSRESEDLLRVLNDLLSRIDQAFEWQRRLVADLGHDLRTPITVLRGSAEAALMRDRTPEQYRAILGNQLEEVDRLALISEALLLLARMEAGALQPHHDRMDLAAAARDAVERLRLHRGITVELAAPESVPLEADRRMVTLQMEELLQNAIQHTPPGTPVRLEVRGGSEEVSYLVEDGGPGVAEAILPRIFELGFRTDTARGRSAGAGLGLTVSAAIAAVHGGGIEASRSELGGLRVSVRLPRVPHPPARSAGPASLPIVTPVPA